MKIAVLSALIVTFANVGILSYSQETAVPFTQLTKTANLPTLMAANDSSSAAASAMVSEPLPAGIPSSGFISRPPAFPVHARVFDRSYFAVNALHLGMAMFDIEMTQHCEAQHTCREANPFMPSSQAGQLSVSLGFFAYSATGSYFFKKHERKSWWLPSAMGTTVHAIGVATGFMHQ
jgi:hypothetical protein